MSQQTASLVYDTTLLNDIIIDLETKFDIKLSFNSDLIQNQLVTFQKEDATLEDIITAIEGQTNIRFVKITKRYYNIIPQKLLDLSTTQTLDEVVINEYLTSGINKKKGGAIVFSPSSLGILPGLTEPDVLQSLQLLPGVQSPSETASGLYIKGGTPDQNLILWDGIKMYHSGHFFGMISAFNPYITKDVKLYTSGTSAKYGSRISSVIDITSSKNIPKTTEGGFGFNLTHADAYIKIPLSNKVAVIASARRSFNDVLESITFKNISKRVFQNTKISDGKKIFEGDDVKQNADLFYFLDYTVKAIIKPSKKDEITVSNLFTKNKLDYGFSIEEIKQLSSDRLNIHNHGTSLSWGHNSSEALSYNFKGYFSNYNLDYIGVDAIGESYKTTTSRANDVTDLGLSFNTTWKINTSNTLGLGYQLSSNEINSLIGYNDKFGEQPEQKGVLENNQANNTHSIYADYKYKLGNIFEMNIGLRANYISAFKKAFFEPRLYLQTRLNRNLNFKVSLERINQAVSQIVELGFDNFGLENQIWVLADGEDVPILKSFQLTSGFAFSKKGWKVDVDGYIKNIDGLSSLTRGFSSENNNFSIGKSKVLGVDVLIKKKINNYRTWLSYSLISNKFTFQDIDEGKPFPGNFDIRNHVTWSHSYLLRGFNFSLGWNLRSGIPFTKAIGILEEEGVTPQVNYGKTNLERLPSYSRLDFSVTYKFNFSESQKWKGKLGLSLLNITDTQNLLGKQYKVSSVFDGEKEVNSLQEINKYSLGVTPNIVFRVEF